MDNKIFTLKEVADYLRMSISELRKLVINGEICYFEIGEANSKRKVKRFRKCDIEDFIRNNMKGANN